MSEVQSGKELCDQFFEALTKRDDIDQEIVGLLNTLYSEVKLTGENILEGLKTPRTEKEGATESQA